MQLSVHLTFAGQCEEAFGHYQRLLDGSDLGFFRYGDSPMAAEVPPDWRDKVVHANLTIGGHLLMGADVPPGRYQPPQGLFVFLRCPDAAEAERVFAAFADGGSVQMPLQKTFWSPSFGVVVDRFGVPWEVSCDDGGVSATG